MRASRCESPPPLYPRADGSIINADDIDCVLNRSCVVSVYLFLLNSTCRLSCTCLTLIHSSCIVSSLLIRSFSLICSSWTVLHVSHPFVLDLFTSPARWSSFLMCYFSLITLPAYQIHLMSIWALLCINAAVIFVCFAVVIVTFRPKAQRV